MLCRQKCAERCEGRAQDTGENKALEENSRGKRPPTPGRPLTNPGFRGTSGWFVRALQLTRRLVKPRFENIDAQLSNQTSVRESVALPIGYRGEESNAACVLGERRASRPLALAACNFAVKRHICTNSAARHHCFYRLNLDSYVEPSGHLETSIASLKVCGPFVFQINLSRAHVARIENQDTKTSKKMFGRRRPPEVTFSSLLSIACRMKRASKDFQ